MAENYQLPGIYAEVQDGGLRISRPTLQPKVTLLGYCNNTGVVSINDPYTLERREDAYRFDNVNAFGAHTPSELSRAISEAFDGGADNIEVMVIGTGFVSHNQRYTDLTTSYELLLNTDIDIVVPVDAKIDHAISDGTVGEERNFAYQLADFCYNATINRNTAIGAVGITPPVTGVVQTPTLAEMNTWIEALKDFDTSTLYGRDYTSWDGFNDADGDGIPDNYAFWATSDKLIPAGSPPAQATTVLRDALGNPIDIGAYISVLVAHVKSASAIAKRINPTYGWYYHDGTATYAGLVASMPPKNAPTNQILPNSEPSRNISLQQATSLYNRRYVTVLQKPTGNRIVAACTGAYNISQYYRSDFVNLTTVRVVHEAINMVRARCDQFIGKPNNPTNLNAMETEIDEGLGEMVMGGSINDFEFSVYMTPAMKILGEVIVDIKLDVAFEIRRITAKVALVPPGSLG